ncbi:MAG: YoaK family protein [Ktedonobacterales bacterium]
MTSGDPDAPLRPEQDTTLQEQTQAQRRLRDRLLLLLAAVAGYTDAISYVALGQVFAANMTGSTVLLGISLAQRDWTFAARAGVALGGFLVGVVIGAVLTGRRQPGETWPRAVTLALGVEAFILAVFSTLGALLGTHDQHGTVYLLIGLAACAMGIQSAAARALGVLDISTTYLTGTWVGLMAGLARRLRAEVAAEVTSDTPPDQTGAAPMPSIDPQRRDAFLLVVYFVAALLAGLLLATATDTGVRAGLIPLAPVVIIVVLIALRSFRPIAP